jgi:NAD-dependent SIR2 family protein deacetylase
MSTADLEQTMIYLRGSTRAFRCEDCGGNVFTVVATKPRRYRCNGCQRMYVSEP